MTALLKCKSDDLPSISSVFVVQRVVVPRAHPPGARLLKWAFFSALILVTVQLVAAPVPWLSTINAVWQYDKLWSDAFYKQISGYSLLIILLLGILLSVRKHLLGNARGSYVTWRSVHSAFGVLGIVALTAHTGLRLGSGFNLLLAISFLALVTLGGLTALFTAVLSSASSGLRFLRSLARSVHQCSAYLALLLISFHVAMFYYF